MDSNPPRRYALIDGNNFYVSCEQAFNPDLVGRPVVVLSNNDGCAVSRSPEAKALGIRMAAPWHEIAHLAGSHGLLACSSNYPLYGDMSRRVMATLAMMAPRQQVYSIDECFADLTGVPDAVGLARRMRARVRQVTQITCGIGLGSTRTRAKLANHVAKQGVSCDGVFDLEALTAAEQTALLRQLPVRQVWGVGPRLAESLRSLGIVTVHDLQQADPQRIQRRFSITLRRTVDELNGRGGLDLDEVAPDRQQIQCTRSFSRPVLLLADLEQAVIAHAARAAEKLRSQGSTTQAVWVFARNSPFLAPDRHYRGTHLVTLAEPTQDSRCIARAAVSGMRVLYRAGIGYKKAGLMLTGLAPADARQRSLFARGDDVRSQALMTTLDRINRRHGRGMLSLGASGMAQDWHGRSQQVSPGYTTCWDGLMVAQAD